MSRALQAHPSRDELRAFGLGKLPAGAAAEVERHVAACDACCAELRRVEDDTLVGRLRAADTPLGGSAETPAPPAAPAGVPPELADHPRYRVVRLLGAGGMGVVYQAEHRLMERPVALKVIHRSLVSNPLAVERFRLEVRAAARLAHRNIVTAYDAEQAGGLHFLVMEFVEGTDLARQVARRGPLPVAHACNYARQAALGLQRAFEHGMVHRDIKPQNLMLTPKGQVKILDFGLARLPRAQGPGSVPGTLPAGPDITGAGTVLGTPDYIAPEQATDSRQVDIRADIYSLGCTLYFLLTGRPPFPGGAVDDKLAAHAGQVPEPGAGVPPALTRVLERLMAKDPRDRFQTPAEVVQALTPFAGMSSRAAAVPVAAPAAAPATVVRRRGRLTRVMHRPRLGRRVLLAGAAGVLLGGALLLALVFLERRSGSKTAGASGGRPRVLLVLPGNGFAYAEYAPVRQELERQGVAVRVASTDRRAVPTGAGGEPVAADLLLGDVRAADIDAVVFIGGQGIGEFKEPTSPGGRAVRRLVDDLRAARKPVAALGMGPVVIADALAQSGQAATASSLPVVQHYLRGHHVALVDEPVTTSESFITARDAAAAGPFARALVDRLHRQAP